MIRRFHIEDLIHQDASGVVFRALDTETDLTVAIRRFFPFGADGGGLHPDEQTAYDIAINRLAGLSHPALRSVICGGCDPVDGMPFIATEWIEGEPLHELIAQSALPPEAATLLITQALEVCELLSNVLAEEAVWVETELQTIIVSRPESGRGFTFWISPFRWLGGNDQPRGLESIVQLAERAMGWSGQLVGDQAGRGLGGWLKWLRATATTTTLKDARESLAALIGAPPPPPVKKLLVQASRPPVRPIKTSSSKAPLVATLILALITAGVGTWFLLRRSHQVPAAAVKPAEASAPSISASQRAEELLEKRIGDDKARDEKIANQQAAADMNGGVIDWSSRELLISKHGQVVDIAGTFISLGKSSSGKTLYILFADPSDKTAARGVIELKKSPNLSEKVLKRFVEKKIRLRGTIKHQKGSDQNRPDILIQDLASIKEIE